MVFPVVTGILLNELYGNKFKDKLHKPLKYLLPFIMLTAFIFVAFFDETRREVSLLENLNLFFPLLLLNFSTMVAGYYVSKTLKLNHNTSYTISIEMGLQNSVLALFIANQVLDNSKISLIPILYASFSLITTFAIAWVLKKYGSTKRAAKKRGKNPS